MKETPDMLKKRRGALVQLVVIVIALAVLVPQFSQFSQSWCVLGTSNLTWTGIGIIAMLGTVSCATLVYLALVPKKLSIWRTALVQSATYFANRLLPSGLGGIGLNTLYIAKQTNISKTEAAVYATANNLLGFIAFWVCALVASLISGSTLHIPGLSITSFLAVIVIGLIVVVASFLFASIKKNLLNFAGHMWGVLLSLTRQPLRVSLALLANMGITVCYVTVLWCAVRATGGSVQITDLFIAFVAANAALSISPTPGGLGAVEAALTAVLMSTGFEPANALATAVLYRIMSYWLPILPGYIAFRTATQRHYV